jgi:hypothetical protein
MPCAPSLEEQLVMQLDHRERSVSEDWAVLGPLASLAGALMASLRHHHAYESEPRAALDHLLARRLVETTLPPPAAVPKEGWPTMEELAPSRQRVEERERVLRAVEQDLCRAAKLLRRVLAAPTPDHRDRPDLALGLQQRAGADALLSWHARHREQDRAAKRQELEARRRQRPSEAAAIDAQLERLDALTTEQLVQAGPDDWDALLSAPPPSAGAPRAKP